VGPLIDAAIAHDRFPTPATQAELHDAIASYVQNGDQEIDYE
jgi:hypothetical protein